MKTKKIYIAGHLGMVGSAIKRYLEEVGYKNFILRTSNELDLRNQLQVKTFFKKENLEIVIDAATKVGGILANNNYPYQFLIENIQIQNNLINESLQNKIEKFIFLGSSCIYPKFADQPLQKSSLLTDSLEPTNEWYSLAKITGVKACKSIRKQFGKDFVSLMPTNLYGTHDNFDLTSSHVLPAMIRKFHEAKLNDNKAVIICGSGSPMCDFLHVDDLAKAVVFSIENKLPEHLYNVGTGTDLSIKDLANLAQSIVGHQGEIFWDSTKPNGTPRKLMNVSKMNALGWKHYVELEEGIKRTYQWFFENQDNYKKVKLQVS